jgi:hypothetical protein
MHTISRNVRAVSCLLVVLLAAAALVSIAAPARADSGPRCRVNGDGTIATGDQASGNGHTTDFQSNLGTGHWRHVTTFRERFDGRLSILGCHANTGDIANMQGTGSFQGSAVVLDFYLHLEDRTGLGEPDYYSIGIFAGSTLVYTTAGQVASGDFRVMIVA